MTANTLLKTKAIITGFFGICMLFFYKMLMPIYGITLEQSGMMFAQWSGVTFLGIGLICWFAGNAEKSNLFDGILLSLFVCDACGFFVSLSWQLKGVANALGWSTVLLWLVFAAGLGYFRFIKKDQDMEYTV